MPAQEATFAVVTDLVPAVAVPAFSRREAIMLATTLTIAGSDSSGGAGIQADLKAIAAQGGYGASVITALTAQNTQAVTLAEPVSRAMLEAQLSAVFEDLNVVAVKSGMLPTPEAIMSVAHALREYAPAHYVLDPVMISKSGYHLIPAESVSALVSHLLPLASLVTPNTHEAEALSGMSSIRTVTDMEAAGRRILASGARAVLVKGGHLDHAEAVDVLVTEGGCETFTAPRLAARHTHGTGCTYSAAIATRLGQGQDLGTAIRDAKVFLTAAIEAGLEVGHGIGPTNPFHFLDSPEAARARAASLQPGGRAGVP